MVLDLPQVLDTQPVGEFNLFQRLLDEFEFRVGVPWARKLKNSE